MLRVIEVASAESIDFDHVMLIAIYTTSLLCNNRLHCNKCHCFAANSNEPCRIE